MALNSEVQMTIDSTAIPYMSSFSRSYEKNVRTFTKQSGKEVDVVLYNRLVISAKTRCFRDVLDNILAKQGADSVTVYLNLPNSSTPESHTMRITDLSYDFVMDSKDLFSTSSPQPYQQGIYDLSFTLREF